MRFPCDMRSFSASFRALAALGLLSAFALLQGGCSKSGDTNVKKIGKSVSGKESIEKSMVLPNVSTTEEKAPDLSKPPENGGEVLERMVYAYRKATKYTDAGEVRISYDRPGGPEDKRHFDETKPFFTHWTKPNKLRMRFLEAEIVSDGKNFYATLEFFEREILQTQAPQELNSEFVLQDQAMNRMARTPAGIPQPLVLLTSKTPMQSFVQGAAGKELIDDAELEGRKCYRVQINRRQQGNWVFWIDKENYILRRLEYPTESLRDKIEASNDTASTITDAQPKPVDNLTLVATYHNASFDKEIPPIAFQMEIPREAKLVSNFGSQDAAVALVGSELPNFTFTLPSGDKATREQLAGKILVIDFWATSCYPCLVGLPLLNDVYQKYRSNPNVVFMAVSVDRTEIPDQSLQSQFESLKLEIPIVRDLDNMSTTVFRLSRLPTTFIVGPTGKVLDVEIGVQQNLKDVLPKKLDILLAGRDLKELQFDRPSNGQLQVAQAAPASEPEKFNLVPAWTSTEVALPGNVVALPAKDGKQQFLVLEGLRSVVVLDAQGTVVRHENLALPNQPEEAVVSFFRVTTDKDGNPLYIGSAGAQQQFHVFNSEWQLLASLPTTTGHPGIADVQIIDVDHDGSPEVMVGYWDVVGVHCMDLQGARLWKNQSLANVFRLAVTHPDTNGKQLVLAANDRGVLVHLNDKGDVVGQTRVGDKFIRAVYCEDLDQDGASEMLVLTGPNGDVSEFVGLAAGGQELWNYKMPDGVSPVASVEFVTTGQLTADGPLNWVFTGADGSIHIVQADGTLVDKFNFGQSIRGLACEMIDGVPTLIISTEKQVQAIKLEPK